MTACSAAWQGLSAFGTASAAGFWVALEQPGPWGRDALVASHLDAGVGHALAEGAAAAGGRALLIRAVGHHAATWGHGSRRVYVAGGLATAPWLLEGVVLTADAVLGLPWGDIAAGDADAVLAACGWLRRAEHPVLFVCTNAKRDVCCALRGRPVAADAAARHPGRVWECSHTGGHRFAPTGIVLPLGQMLARLTPELAGRVLTAAASGRFAPESLDELHDRGRSHLPPPSQAADSWVRAAEGIVEPDVLRCEPDPDRHTVTVRHADGRCWVLEVTPGETPPLPDSCGKAPGAHTHLRVRPLGGG